MHLSGEDRGTNEKQITYDDQFTSQIKGPLEAGDPRVVRYLMDHYLAPPSTLPYNLTHRYSYIDNSRSQKYSWDFYHHYIKWFFSNQHGGFFLEAGALDGEFLSNTLWLEEKLGWSGLLIEADQNNFRHLTWKRRRAWTSNTCVAEGSFPRQAMFEALDTVPSRPAGTNWLYRANSHETNSFFATLHNDELMRSSRRSYSIVQCFPLFSFLLALNVTVIDLLSLDMQGNEWKALSGLPLDKVAIRSLAVEHVPATTYTPEMSFKTDRSFVTYMANIGYHLVDTYVNVDYFFIQKQDPVLRQKYESHLIKFNAKERR